MATWCPQSLFPSRLRPPAGACTISYPSRTTRVQTALRHGIAFYAPSPYATAIGTVLNQTVTVFFLSSINKVGLRIARLFTACNSTGFDCAKHRNQH